MNEIEGPLGQRIACDVVAAHLDILKRDLVEKPGIDVGDCDASGRTDTFPEPPRDRSTTTADFQAVPPWRDPAIRRWRSVVESNRAARAAKRVEAFRTGSIAALYMREHL
jgi:hypothetical protein